MLTIRVSSTEAFDESTSEFVEQGGLALDLEHSLLSVSKWEAKFERPFLGQEEKSAEEVIAYVKFMCLTPDFPPGIFAELSQSNMNAINDYLNAKQTATWFSDHPSAPQTSREIITSELIYYWMTVFHIPFECERWNLNRLFTLIRICNLKQEKPKKMSRAEIARRNQELNARRKAQMGTSG
jgi:hypothetical protein